MCADHHADRGGFTPSPAANYLELFPFIDSLWYGEGFNYETSSASYWFVEIVEIHHTPQLRHIHGSLTAD